MLYRAPPLNWAVQRVSLQQWYEDAVTAFTISNLSSQFRWGNDIEDENRYCNRDEYLAAIFFNEKKMAAISEDSASEIQRDSSGKFLYIVGS